MSVLLYGQTTRSDAITSTGDAIISDGGAFYFAIGESMDTDLHRGEFMLGQGFLQVSTAKRYGAVE